MKTVATALTCLTVAFGMGGCFRSTPLDEARRAMAEGDAARPHRQLVEAEKSYRRAVAIYEVTPGSDPEQHAKALLALAMTLNDQCRTVEAAQMASRGEHVLGRGVPESSWVRPGLAYARAWNAAFAGDFATARDETERALEGTRSLPKDFQLAVVPDLRAFIADVEEERGNFRESINSLEQALADIPPNYTPSKPAMPFLYTEGIALRLHHAYRIGNATEAALSIVRHYKITAVRTGAPWPPAEDWVTPAGACGGLEQGTSPYEPRDNRELMSELQNCFGEALSGGTRFLINLLFSPDGQVLSAEGAAINLEPDRLKCACTTAMKATLPPAGKGYRSRHLEGDSSGIKPDYRGI